MKNERAIFGLIFGTILAVILGSLSCLDKRIQPNSGVETRRSYEPPTQEKKRDE